MPAINVPLPDSPLPSHAASPDPMAHVDPLAQPAYVHDLTRMLGFMNKSQVHFQEQITQAITVLTSSQAALASSQGAVSDSQAMCGSSTVKLRNPCTFNGRHEEVVPFLSEVQRIIKFHLASFPDNHQKVLFIALYLKDGIPVEWFNHLESTHSPILYNWAGFMTKFQKKFADPQLSSTADQKLEKLKQTGSAHAYLTCFVELSSHLKMTKQMKINRFMKGLKPVIKDNLVSIIDRPVTLMGWENIIIQVNANLHQWDLERKDESKSKHTNTSKTSSSKTSSTSSTSSLPTVTTTSDVVPMEVDAVRVGCGKLMQEERDYHFKNKLCLYCGQPGHLASSHKKKQSDSDQGKAKPESK